MLEINLEFLPVIQTPRLTLNALGLADAADLFEIRSDINAMRYIDRDPMINIQESEEMISKIIKSIKDNEAVSWAVRLKDDPKLIGTMGFWRINKDHHRGELGYQFHPSHFRKGYGQEAIKEVISFGFEVLNFHSQEAVVNPGNEASIGLLEKNGFVREAYFRENYYYNGRFLDSGVYSLLRSVWEGRSETKT